MIFGAISIGFSLGLVSLFRLLGGMFAENVLLRMDGKTRNLILRLAVIVVSVKGQTNLCRTLEKLDQHKLQFEFIGLAKSEKYHHF